MSSHIRARKHQAKQLATLVTLAFPAAAFAQQSVTLPEVKIEAKAEAPYKAEKSANPKYTQPLIDTPQTITVVKKELLLEQGASTLMEALRNTPGITTQLGEGGNTTTGDNFTMRGVASAQSATFVDGIRDLGSVTRDTFNLEQVEIVKGAAGGDIGRGAGAGYINLLTKLPTLENAASGTASINTGNLKRTTADVNRKLNDTSAFRLNVMAQDGGVDGRDYIKNSGWAFAPSAAFGLGTSTRVYAYAQFVEQDNRPDGGIPTIGMPGYYRGAQAPTAQNGNVTVTTAEAAAISAGARVNRENYYGHVSDYERVSAQQATVKLEHDLAGGGVLRNITRVGRTDTSRVVSAPNAIIGGLTPSTWTTSLTRQGLDQRNDIIANQTTLNKTFGSGFLVQDVVMGLELMAESQRTQTMGNSTAGTNSVYNPNPNLAVATPSWTGAFTDGKTNTTAVYANDTIKLGSAWQLNGGIRAEHYSTTTSLNTLAQAMEKSGWLYSWKTGVLFKPASNGSIYAAISNAMTPPGSADFALASSTTSANNPNVDPQQTRNKELGTKWDFLDKKLGLSVAYYETSIKNEAARLDTTSNTYVSYGDRSVKGVELGLVGAITDKWYVSAGVATMDTKVESATGTTNNVGATARYSPDLSATLWSTYNTGKWSAGFGARYMSDQKRDVSLTSNPATTTMPIIPSYTVFDAMASYQVSKNMMLRLNVYNLTDKFYINSINNNGSRAILGAPRSATLTASFQF